MHSDPPSPMNSGTALAASVSPGHFLGRLRELYAEMDRAYAEVAERYGFHCQGCAESCCETRFHHHTHVEVALIREGVRALSLDQRRDAVDRAVLVVRRMAEMEAAGETPRAMCPLNDGGLCQIYAYRPMICRLHGLPHEVRRPGRAPEYAPGCHEFTREYGSQEYIPLDRTPFYLRLSQLEGEYRAALGLGVEEKVRLTIAEILRQTVWFRKLTRMGTPPGSGC